MTSAGDYAKQERLIVVESDKPRLELVGQDAPPGVELVLERIVVEIRNIACVNVCILKQPARQKQGDNLLIVLVFSTRRH